MAPTRHREKRLSLSVPGRQVRQVAASKSEENLGLKINNRSRDTRRQSSSSPSSSAAANKQKTRTISVPAGLKEILNDLSKEVEYIPECCHQQNTLDLNLFLFTSRLSLPSLPTWLCTAPRCWS